MSVIEQAAKRLEELRRAGAELNDNAPAAAGAELPPTPEAVMRTMEARTSTGHARPPRSGPEALSRVVPAGERDADHLARHVVLDLARLKQRGFVTPDAPKSQIADEFRVLKRPIIRNALGHAGVRVKHGNLVMVTSRCPARARRSRRSISPSALRWKSTAPCCLSTATLHIRRSRVCSAARTVPACSIC